MPKLIPIPKKCFQMKTKCNETGLVIYWYLSLLFWILMECHCDNIYLQIHFGVIFTIVHVQEYAFSIDFGGIMDARGYS